jgi:hypothetical protein
MTIAWLCDSELLRFSIGVLERVWTPAEVSAETGLLGSTGDHHVVTQGVLHAVQGSMHSLPVLSLIRWVGVDVLFLSAAALGLAPFARVCMVRPYVTSRLLVRRC